MTREPRPPDLEITFAELKRHPRTVRIMRDGMVLTEILLVGVPAYTPGPLSRDLARPALLAVNVNSSELEVDSHTIRGINLSVPVHGDQEPADDPS